ncbi:guanylate kinase [Candidatus Kaiserbacteria bacterium CG10_big_fil_rev_8_21_14_0_10_59_10]|uniref:Guanylate kinase n=1 Tax=Candidatus Kaiserbacteria bacterium CG10_big_fil_rev_8_21_14_0_10_59_10 TaxID=1974612 RepID=A0A2H0U8R7_9BACT|nr:MAG: guanylate kinase [Candidatus Kaiserbacteria bacterium CG10_big_fil_rev_8_21_14_0_10_59_10]
MPRRNVVVVAGPTGSGETTFTHELILAYPNFVRLVTATTRPPRPGEREGYDYFFMTKERFFEEVQEGNIVEHTHVPNRDAWYGTYLPELEKQLKAGKTLVVNTDLRGAKYYKEKYRAITIFIKPKSLDVLRGRIMRRDPTISEREVNSRMQQALEEINEAENRYDYVVWNADGEFVDTIGHVVEILKKEGYDV